jgi:hypothetical protein
MFLILAGLEKKRTCSVFDRKPADWWVLRHAYLVLDSSSNLPTALLSLIPSCARKFGAIESVGAVNWECESLPVDLNLSLRLRPVCCPGQIREFVVVENLCTAPKPKQNLVPPSASKCLESCLGHHLLLLSVLVGSVYVLFQS